MKVTINFELLPPNTIAGLRQDWISGTVTPPVVGGKGKRSIPFEVTCGAGLGSPALYLSFKGKTYSATIVPTIQEAINIILDGKTKRKK